MSDKVSLFELGRHETRGGNVLVKWIVLHKNSLYLITLPDYILECYISSMFKLAKSYSELGMIFPNAKIRLIGLVG